ncbi:FAD:protein FMN transferase [Photobacterium sagamiensis]|uniref:FAD:protein FMN transferase n=1 Tax=Photobacterium sagamiensis TaxID=2910241 RepID=UPI003D0C1A9C
MDTLINRLERKNGHWHGTFTAMASLCEVLIEPCEYSFAKELLDCAQQITADIETKFSRYRSDNLCYQINHSNGKPVSIDPETFSLLSFADTCFEISGGLFDLTSGVLRNAWKFDGSDNVPSQQQIDRLLPNIGWEKISFDANTIIVPGGMEIDFGGIGKEYAVDRVATELARLAPALSVLVNFGGDLAVSKPKVSGESWSVGFESTKGSAKRGFLILRQGGLATSGDAHRYLLKDNIRYSHILNPRTGWPVSGGPAQVTVAGSNCVQAGILSTIAMLHGNNAKAFLDMQEVRYWIR